MKSTIKNLFIGAACMSMAVLQSGCNKDVIAPANQSVAFIKYYGHVAKQSGADMIKTSDGGFLLVGSTNSYGTESESDALIIKTDSLGNEQWSTALGRSPESGAAGTAFESFYLRFDEEGRQAAELPDGSAYIVGVNRTYIRYPNSNSPVGTRLETKIILYLIDAASGAATSADGFELRSATNGQSAINSYSEKLNDIFIDNSGGILEYVVTGLTTEVSTKPNNNNANNALTDKSDMFTALLDENFNIQWSLGNVAYGFQGADYGVSIHKVTTINNTEGYMVCGVMDQNVAPNITDPYDFYPSVVAVIYDITTGTPTLPEYYGGAGYFFELGQSIHDKSNRRITLVASVAKESGGGNANVGKLAVLQIDESAVVQSIGSNIGDFGFTYYGLESIVRNGKTIANPNGAGGATPYEATSINLLPNSEGFIISSTYEASAFENKICILKIDANFNIQNGWPYYFGYEDSNASFSTQDKAGTIIPITSAIAGTSQNELMGYAMTGTFGLGTNKMIGLVKLNSNGTFTSQ